MKLSIFITTVFVFILQYGASAQTEKKSTPPSDATSGYTYDFDRTNTLIIERLLNPSVANEDVKMIVEEKSFPKLNKGQAINADYKKKIAVWVEKNPSLIISNLKNRTDIVHPF